MVMGKIRKFAASVVAGALTVVLCAAPAGAALADSLAPGQVGSGISTMSVTLPEGEFGGTGAYATGDYANPDRGDGYGANIAFSVPADISYVMRADGTLVGPSSEIYNVSAFPIHVSSLQVNAETGWTFTNTTENVVADDSVYLTLGPVGDALNLGNYMSKADVTSPGSWNLEQGDVTPQSLTLVTSGKVFNLTHDVTAGATTFGTINWYVKSGYGKSLPAHKATLGAYTVEELSAIAADISEFGSSSAFYSEFVTFMQNDEHIVLPLDSTAGDYDASWAEADQSIEFRIIGINHDDLADGTGKAGLTFQATHSLPVGYRQNSSNTNSGGWAASELRTKMNSGRIYELMPTDVKEHAQAVLKYSNNVGGGSANYTAPVTSSADTFFIASYAELASAYTGTTAAWVSSEWLPNEGSQYEYWTYVGINDHAANPSLVMNTTRSGGAFTNGDGSYLSTSLWWERSCSPNYTYYFCTVSSTGFPSGYNFASYALGVVPCFSL